MPWSYGDAYLEESDVALLRGPHWLNDAVIGFAFECMQHEGAAVAFFHPATVQMAAFLAPDALELLLEPLALAERQVVLLPLSDNAEAERAGGSHWTLLAYFRCVNEFVLFDSCEPASSRRVGPRAIGACDCAGKYLLVYEG